MTTENIKLYDRDYVEILLETAERDVAREYFLQSGEDWLPMTISYGPNWRQRWSGQIRREADGAAALQDGQYLKYILSWPGGTA